MPGIVTITLNPTIDIRTSVERIASEHKLRCDGEQRDPGGGGINVARVVRRLGGDALALYPTGGAIGRLLDEYLASEGIRTRTSPIEGLTRESFTVSERSSGREFRFILPGPLFSADAHQALLDALETMRPAPSFVVLSGSLPPGAPTDSYGQFARLAARIGSKVALDASGPALRAALETGVHLVKPSVRELEDLAGSVLADEGAIISAAKSLIAARRAEIVVVTMGARGALLATSNETLIAEAIPVAVVSTVGAGDSLMGAMVYSLDRGDNLADAFILGIAAATATLLVPGTQLCSREDANRFAPGVSIRSFAAAHEVDAGGPVLGSQAPHQAESVDCGAASDAKVG